MVFVGKDEARNEETEDEEDAGERCKVIELNPVLEACGSEITIATCVCTRIGRRNFRRWLLTFSRRSFTIQQAENGLQSRSSKNGKTAVWHYGLKLQ